MVYLNKIVKSVLTPFVSRYQKWRHRNPVQYTYKNVGVNVLPGVFSPVMNSSTSLFLEFIQGLEIKHKTVLELGCGSGVISAYCAANGAMVTASDINDVALSELSVQARDNNWDIISVYSDLFDNLQFHFDYILINPPILPENPMNIEEKGSMAGVNFKFYESLFNQLKIRTLRDTQVFLFLPEEAELFSICRRAKQNHLSLKTIKVIHMGLDNGTVYRVVESV